MPHADLCPADSPKSGASTYHKIGAAVMIVVVSCLRATHAAASCLWSQSARAQSVKQRLLRTLLDQHHRRQALVHCVLADTPKRERRRPPKVLRWPSESIAQRSTLSDILLLAICQQHVATRQRRAHADSRTCHQKFDESG